MGTAGTGYRQNLVFNKNAFSLVMVANGEAAPGAVTMARKSYKGYSVRRVEGQAQELPSTNADVRWTASGARLGETSAEPRHRIRGVGLLKHPRRTSGWTPLMPEPLCLASRGRDGVDTNAVSRRRKATQLRRT